MGGRQAHVYLGRIRVTADSRPLGSYAPTPFPCIVANIIVVPRFAYLPLGLPEDQENPDRRIHARLAKIFGRRDLVIHRRFVSVRVLHSHVRNAH